MNYFDKIQTVRDSVLLWEKEHINEFTYVVSEFGYENDFEGHVITIKKGEVWEIISYLAKTKFIEILSKSPTSARIKVKGGRNTIKSKTLELISRELKDHYTGLEIIKFLKESGIDSKFIVYPESKWLMFYRVFYELSLSWTPEDEKLLFKIISSSVHPLNFGGQVEKSETLIKKFNDLLKYDDYKIQTDSDGRNFYVTSIPPDIPPEVEEAWLEEHYEELQNEQEDQHALEIGIFKQPENKERIAQLHKAYRTIMNVVEVFCENSTNPTSELNQAYQKLRNIVYDTTKQLGLVERGGIIEIFSFYHHSLKFFYLPFFNLFSAEKEFKEQRKVINWNNIRPEMNMMFGEIDQLYQAVNASEILSEPDIQKVMNDTMLLLSETKEKNKQKLQKESAKQPVTRIEITKIPELQLKQIQEDAIVKNKKRISLPKFDATDWSKITIRFLDENNIHIKTNKKTAVTDFEGLGFSNDKNGKPNSAWKFLMGLAMNNGETLKIASPVPDNIKQQKKVVSDRLKTLFKNDTDPFYDFSETNTYKTKFTLLPFSKENKKDIYGVDEYLSETMTSDYEQD